MSEAQVQLSTTPDNARLSLAHCPTKNEVSQ
jgi:hypothetical protein